MTLEKTIQNMFNNSPILFQERKECLNHLFCVIGNGYEWYNGELIDVNYIKYKNPEDDDYEIVSIYNPDIILKGENIAKQTISSDEYDILKNEFGDFEWYGVHKGYSYLIDYPSNITDDWMNGIIETRKLLLQDRIDYKKCE